MSLLDVRVWAVVLALLALISLRGKRWAYLAFVVLGLLYFPTQTHFRVHAPKCEQLIPTMHVLVLSLRNYAHIALFAGFYWMSWVQFRRTDARRLGFPGDPPRRSPGRDRRGHDREGWGTLPRAGSRAGRGRSVGRGAGA